MDRRESVIPMDAKRAYVAASNLRTFADLLHRHPELLNTDEKIVEEINDLAHAIAEARNVTPVPGYIGLWSLSELATRFETNVPQGGGVSSPVQQP
jgi:hypothetical protein